MTDNLMQKLEEKVMSLVAELENLRKELNYFKQENATIKAEKHQHAKKLQSLISSLDTLDLAHSPVNHELELIQGDHDHIESYA